MSRYEKNYSLDKIVASLEEMRYKIEINDQVRIKAKRAIDRMVAVLPTK